MALSRRTFVSTSLAAVAASYAPDLLAAEAGGKFWVYIGTATGAKSKGIYLAQLDTATGAIADKGLAATTVSPTFIAVDRDMGRMVAVNESARTVTTFRLDRKTGQLTTVNSQPSGGTTPVHISFDNNGKNVLVANFASGSIEVVPVGPDGTLKAPSDTIQHMGRGPNASRQAGPHAHGMYPDPSGKYVLAPDLGLDKIFIYTLDGEKGTLNKENVPFGIAPPGQGPRQLTFSHDNKFIYVINEVGNSMSVFTWDPAKPAMTEIQTLSTLPPDFKGNSSAAQIALHPNGKFLYGSNRTHDSVAIFAVDGQTGKLTAKGHVPSGGRSPRSIAIDPTGQLLFAGHQNTDFVTAFKINAETGELTAANDSKMAVTAGICILFVPVG